MGKRLNEGPKGTKKTTTRYSFAQENFFLYTHTHTEYRLGYMCGFFSIINYTHGSKIRGDRVIITNDKGSILSG